MNTKTLTILAVVAAIAVIGAVLALRSDKAAGGGTAVPQGKAAPGLFSDLPSKVGDVAAISVKTTGGETNLELVDGNWQVKEKAGYPADPDKVRGVMLGLAGLRNWTEKTSRPELYKTLGVEEPVKKEAAAPAPADAPEAAQSQAMLLTLKDKAAQPITSVIVGNTKWGQGGGMGGGSQGVYLRKPGDVQSYYADGKLEVPRETLMWLKNEFANIARDRVRSVTVTPRENVEADRIVVTAEKPGAGGFKVEGIPAGKQLKDAGLSETVVAGLTSTMFEDVNKLEAVDFAGTGTPTPGKPGSSVDVRTWDGLRVHVDTVQVGDKWWWKLSASADPDPFKEGEGDAAKPKRTAEEVKKEVDELNAKWAGWAFAPYSYKSSAFTKKLSEEVKMPDAAPVPGAAPTGLPPGFPGVPGGSGQPAPVPPAPPVAPQPQP